MGLSAKVDHHAFVDVVASGAQFLDKERLAARIEDLERGVEPPQRCDRHIGSVGPSRDLSLT
jgi:hypothetical protein